MVLVAAAVVDEEEAHRGDGDGDLDRPPPQPDHRVGHHDDRQDLADAQVGVGVHEVVEHQGERDLLVPAGDEQLGLVGPDADEVVEDAVEGQRGEGDERADQQRLLEVAARDQDQPGGREHRLGDGGQDEAGAAVAEQREPEGEHGKGVVLAHHVHDVPGEAQPDGQEHDVIAGAVRGRQPPPEGDDQPDVQHEVEEVQEPVAEERVEEAQRDAGRHAQQRVREPAVADRPVVRVVGARRVQVRPVAHGEAALRERHVVAREGVAQRGPVVQPAQPRHGEHRDGAPDADLNGPAEAPQEVGGGSGISDLVPLPGSSPASRRR